MPTLDPTPDTNASPPEGFDARQFPVIAAHFFGLVVYPRSNDVVATDKVAA